MNPQEAEARASEIADRAALLAPEEGTKLILDETKDFPPGIRSLIVQQSAKMAEMRRDAQAAQKASQQIQKAEQQAREKMDEAQSNRRLTHWGFCLGAAFLVTCIVLVFKYPELNGPQWWIIRLTASLAGGGFTSALTGFLNVKGTFKRLSFSAAGGLAVFFTTFFYNPPPPPGSGVGQKKTEEMLIAEKRSASSADNTMTATGPITTVSANTGPTQVAVNSPGTQQIINQRRVIHNEIHRELGIRGDLFILKLTIPQTGGIWDSGEKFSLQIQLSGPYQNCKFLSGYFPPNALSDVVTTSGSAEAMAKGYFELTTSTPPTPGVIILEFESSARIDVTEIRARPTDGYGAPR